MQCLPSNDMFYCDAAFEPETKTGGIGAVIFDSVGTCVGWFGFSLDETTCNSFGADKKHPIIYELELCAAVLALAFWADRMNGGLQVCFGDNDGARFSLIRGPDIIFTERPQTIYAFGMLECLQRLTSVTFLRGELTTLC